MQELMYRLVISTLTLFKSRTKVFNLIYNGDIHSKDDECLYNTWKSSHKHPHLLNTLITPKSLREIIVLMDDKFTISLARSGIFLKQFMILNALNLYWWTSVSSLVVSNRFQFTADEFCSWETNSRNELCSVDFFFSPFRTDKRGNTLWNGNICHTSFFLTVRNVLGWIHGSLWEFTTIYPLANTCCVIEVPFIQDIVLLFAKTFYNEIISCYHIEVISEVHHLTTLICCSIIELLHLFGKVSQVICCGLIIDAVINLK